MSSRKQKSLINSCHLDDATTGVHLETKTLVRLDAVQYRELERRLPPPAVTNSTSDLMAGYQLGVQAVLKLIREGFTIGET